MKNFNLKGVTAGTWARLIALLVAIVNQVLTSNGINPIPYSEDQTYQAVTAVFTVGATLIATWKNNSLTENAQSVDNVLKAKKSNVVMDADYYPINEPTEEVETAEVSQTEEVKNEVE